MALGETAASIVRVLLVVFVALGYLTVTGPAGSIVWLAAVVLVLAGAYSLYLYVGEPYRGSELRWGKLGVSAADLILTLAWLYATGGFASPYHPLLDASIIALSFRYDLWGTLVGAGAHVGGYAALLYLTSDLAANLAEATIQGGFIVLLGTLGALLSMATGREPVAEGPYRELVDDLRRSVSLHEATLDATRDGILVVDNEGRIVSYNDRFQQMWGIPDEVVATRDDEAALASVLDELEDPEGFLARVEELYQHPAAESVDEIELTDGRIFERVSRPQRLDGEIVGRVWSFHDITEEREARAEIERSNRELRRFTSAASHDLREPLRGITTYLDRLATEAERDLDDRARDHLTYARESARRLDRMLDGLRRYSRLDRQGTPIGPVDLNAAVDDTRENLRAAIEREDARIETDELPTVRGDRAQLATLFQNLFANAIRYNDEGNPRVTVTAEEEPGRVRVAVADEGPGIPPKEQDAIFEMFRQGSSHASPEGEGVGLAMCQKIVERHGGEIEVSSTPGEGTTFAFTLEPSGA